MKNFLILYNAPIDAVDMMANATPEQKEAGMKPWIAWQNTLGDKLVDMGAPLGPGKRITPSGNELSADTQITGYTILRAKDLEEAKSLIRNHPHLGWMEKCSIDIHETFSL